MCFYRQTNRQTETLQTAMESMRRKCFPWLTFYRYSFLSNILGVSFWTWGHVKPLKVIKFVLLPEYLLFRKAPHSGILHNIILGNCTTIFQVRTKPVPLCQSLGQAPCHLHVLNHGGCTHTEGADSKQCHGRSRPIEGMTACVMCPNMKPEDICGCDHISDN